VRLLASLLLATWVVLATAQTPPKPGAKDLCPVCGMLVSKYPNWVATIVYKDGHAHHFDGAKDMFKFWHDPAKYAAGHKREDMAAIRVTDFYNLQPSTRARPLRHRFGRARSHGPRVRAAGDEGGCRRFPQGPQGQAHPHLRPGDRGSAFQARRRQVLKRRT
jgi:hypothetical protein